VEGGPVERSQKDVALASTIAPAFIYGCLAIQGSRSFVGHWQVATNESGTA
jgi:hypothetical protein